MDEVAGQANRRHSPRTAGRFLDAIHSVRSGTRPGLAKDILMSWEIFKKA
jgi:hypothetical protein